MIPREEIRQTFVRYLPWTNVVNYAVLKGDVILLLKPELTPYINPRLHYAVSPNSITEIPTLG